MYAEVPRRERDKNQRQILMIYEWQNVREQCFNFCNRHKGTVPDFNRPNGKCIACEGELETGLTARVSFRIPANGN